MEGKEYTVKVEQIHFGYSYEAEATASYSTPADTEVEPLDVSRLSSAWWLLSMIWLTTQQNPSVT